MANEQAQVVVCPGSFMSELLPGGVGEVVCLSDAHFLLLATTEERVKVGGGFGGRGDRRRVHGGPEELLKDYYDSLVVTQLGVIQSQWIVVGAV